KLLMTFAAKQHNLPLVIAQSEQFPQTTADQYLDCRGQDSGTRTTERDVNPPTIKETLVGIVCFMGVRSNSRECAGRYSDVVPQKQNNHNASAFCHCRYREVLERWVNVIIQGGQGYLRLVSGLVAFIRYLKAFTQLNSSFHRPLINILTDTLKHH